MVIKEDDANLYVNDLSVQLGCIRLIKQQEWKPLSAIYFNGVLVWQKGDQEVQNEEGLGKN